MSATPKKKLHSNGCSCTIIHKEAVEDTLNAMPEIEPLFELAETFRIFGDSTRIRILYALRTRELCVCDLCAALGMTQSAISHQLRILKQARLVRFRKEGKVVYYRLDDMHVGDILDVGMQHVTE